MSYTRNNELFLVTEPLESFRHQHPQRELAVPDLHGRQRSHHQLLAGELLREVQQAGSSLRGSQRLAALRHRAFGKPVKLI